MSLKVTLTDGSVHEVETKPGDIARFERHFGIAASSMSDESTTVEQTMFLAFAGCKRMGTFHGTFEEFLDLVDDFVNVPKAAEESQPPKT